MKYIRKNWCFLMMKKFNCSHAGEDPDFKSVPAGYINKMICGCGLTSVALENNEDCIIAVPNVALVRNKVMQYYNTQERVQGNPDTGPRFRFPGEVFGVYGDITKDDANSYVRRVRAAGTPIKILVTYDSLRKVEHLVRKDVDILLSAEMNGTCHLIIDESDKLIGYMTMKVDSRKEGEEMDVVTYLLGVAKRCKTSVSFISATPIDLAYMPKWVSEIEQVELQWEHTEKIVPIVMKRTYPYKALKEEIIMPMSKKGMVTLGGSEIRKVIVFINSVEKIIQVAKECELSKDEVAIVCGDNSKNSFKIRGYNVLTDPHKLPKYTFITSSGFQGIDLFDSEAMNVVVSSTNKSHQMIDLNTDLIQATSRQRRQDNPHFNRFVYIYDQSPFEEKTEAELIAEMDRVHQRISDNCKTLSKMSKNQQEYESAVKTFKQSNDFHRYTYKLTQNGNYSLNEQVFNAEKYRILETRKRYTKGFDIAKDCFESKEIKPIIVRESRISSNLSYNAILPEFGISRLK